MPMHDLEHLQSQLPPGPLLDTLGGARVLSVDAQGSPRVEFTARPEFCHTNGTIVQGGFVTAWLDFAMAFATALRTEGRSGVASLDINVSFLERVGPGKVIVEGRVRRLGKRVAFLEATLFDERGTELATATSTGMLVPR
ncbi:MAG: PaaI family thioesterase [Burkholderiaceae bacterium]